ncbi:MAG: hypothetical protein IJ716_09350 [Lachnospiraceae bacterium]|nr:hypothetical protein [Lachnospiraceae bacterium]
MSPRTGRPPKCDGESKGIRLEIRLNQQQNRLLNELAKKYGLSRTDTILKALSLLAEQK